MQVDEGQAPSFPTIEADLNSDDQHEPHRTHTDRDSGSCSEAGTVSRNFRFDQSFTCIHSISTVTPGFTTVFGGVAV